MKISEKKLAEYLENHIGENCRTVDLAKECGIYEEGKDFEIGLKEDSEIRRIAKENGFRLNDDHHADEFLGMPWSIDFYIEIADVKKDIRRINSAFQLKMKRQLIVEEYGIYKPYDDDYLIGFRLSIPWQIKKIYDEISEQIDEMEKDGRIID